MNHSRIIIQTLKIQFSLKYTKSILFVVTCWDLPFFLTSVHFSFQVLISLFITRIDCIRHTKSKSDFYLYIYQKPLKQAFKTGFSVQNNISNLCVCIVNSQRFFCSRITYSNKAFRKTIIIQSLPMFINFSNLATKV